MEVKREKEEAADVKPYLCSPSQTEDKAGVAVWIKVEPCEDAYHTCDEAARDCSVQDPPKPSSLRQWEESNLLPCSEQERRSGIVGPSVLKQEEGDFGKGEVVLKGEDFVVTRDPDYESDEEEVDVKCEVKEERESGEMEVCADSSAAMAGASSSTRQTGQSLCPASACLASSGGEAAADWRGRGGGNGVDMMSRYGVRIISGGIPYLLPAVPIPASPSGLNSTAAPRALVLMVPALAAGTTLPPGGTSLVGGGFRAAGCEDSSRGNEDPSSHVGSSMAGPSRPTEVDYETPRPSREKRFPCSECDKAFTLKGNLTKHIAAIHRDKKRFSCSECEKVFRWQNVLDKHVKTVHRGERNFQCTLCGWKFAEESNLVSHLATNLRRGEQECSKCQRTFKTKCSLQAHYADEHADLENQNPCQECGKNFSDKGNLKKHVAHVHRGEKNFLCSECGKAFSSKEGRDRHVKGVHRGKKDFACEECGKKFLEKIHMLKHLANVHRK